MVMESTTDEARAELRKLTNGGPSHHEPTEPTDENEIKLSENTGGCSCLKKVSHCIVSGLELTFYRLGKLVALHPVKTILTSILLCSVAGLGLMKWHEEKEYVKVWLPRGSRVEEEYAWVQEHFPEKTRFESVIVEDENVLSPQSINDLFDLYQAAMEFRTQSDLNILDLCIRAGPLCRTTNLLELWAYNETVIRNLTSADIYSMVNQDTIISPVFRNELEVTSILGGIYRDNNSRIIGAHSTKMLWLLERQEKTEEAVMEWEKQLIDYVNRDQGHGQLTKLYIYTARTFDDEGLGAAARDSAMLMCGFALVFLFIVLTIGKFSLIGQKVLLAIAGLFSIAMAIVFTYGVGFGLGIMFGPIHQITPFMLLGIGVDDMFVIMQSLAHLSDKEKKLPVEERVAVAMKHAGVSITVTSVTDIVAFAIGGSTVIPCLSTFCVYAAIGVFALYLLQATYFVACLTLDEKRIDSRRNACLPCFKHSPTYSPNKRENFSILHLFMEKVWGPFVTKTPVKIGILLVALGLVSLNVWSFLHLKHDFDPSMYLPANSYSTQYIKADRKLFPDDGAYVQLYCDQVNVSENVDNLLALYDNIQTNPSVQNATVNFWLAAFDHWVTLETNTTIRSPAVEVKPLDGNSSSTGYVYEEEDFYRLLRQFLRTNYGQMYYNYIEFDNDVYPRHIKSSVLWFNHVKCTTSVCSIAAMDTVQEVVDNFRFNGGGTCFAYSNPQYMFNETNKVLQLELYRNLALAAVCVFVVTLVLIANLWTSILVFICVVSTVIDVAGTMQFWDISVDTASSVILILCFGLAVDYSAHIGHTFMTAVGSHNERTRRTLITIGPAVFSGGFSTFLAFLLLVNSISYGFTLFFRIFTSVVIFGLFHGLAVLPVILSIIGPESYMSTSLSHRDQTVEVKCNGDLHETVKLSTAPFESSDKTNNCNGVLHKCDSDSRMYDGYNQMIQDFNPRYSGSYYEQLSNGSLVQIPYPAPSLGSGTTTH